MLARVVLCDKNGCAHGAFIREQKGLNCMKKRINLKGRSLLKISDLSDDELIYLLDLADRLKRKKKRGVRGNLLARKNIALIFEKASTRTRSAFTVAAVDEGGSVEL